jgi:hypothetical protein
MLTEEIQVNKKSFQKMLFLTNAIEKGWTVKKTKNSYVFKKKHENKREILNDEYLDKFIDSNLDINLLLGG